MKKVKIILILLISVVTLTQAQTDNGMMRMDEFRNPKKRKIIQIPGFDGFQTLKCDFTCTPYSPMGLCGPPSDCRKFGRRGLM